MKSKYLLLLLIFFNTADLVAQGDLVNMKKYWFYRHRLLKDFMAKGDCQGCSEALNERALSGTNIAKWGDNTINLANYISILATEYELLSQQSQPTDSTLEELYYAFRAFNRLDAEAEESLGPYNRPTVSASPTTFKNQNGFFIRDDVYQNFLMDHPKLAKGVTSSREIHVVNSDFIDPVDHLKEMSHDQVWHLMMGFALVRKYIPPGLSWQGKPLNDVDFNTDIWQEAENITGRMINRIKDDNWNIYNPNTGARVLRGSYVQELSYGAAEAACYIKNGNVALDPGFPIHTCNDYHNFVSYTTADAWMDFAHGYGDLITIHPEEDFKVQILAALGNSWWNRSNPFLPDPYLVLTILFDPTNFLHPFTTALVLVAATVPVFPSNVTIPELAARATLKDYQHLPLLRQVLHGGANLIPGSYYQNLLDLGPCDGPHNFGPTDISTFEWSSSNRLHHPNHRGGLSNEGEYNGLDYMLYYNLYHIVAGNTVPNVNFMDRMLTFPFPTSDPIPVGTTTLPVTIEAFNTITASNTINNLADVCYRAGTEIHFKPGFSVYPGANFHAYIDPFYCSSGDYRNSNAYNDTQDQPPSDDRLAYSGPTTFVHYPQRNTVGVESDPESGLPYPAPDSINSAFSNQGHPQPHYSTIVISPNPNNGAFQITISNGDSSAGIKEMKVMDIMGNTVWSAGPSNSRSFIADISAYSSGIYYLRYTNTLNEVEIKKLIKQ